MVPHFDFVEKLYSLGESSDGFAAFDELINNDDHYPDQDLRSDDAYVIIHTAAVAGKPRGATLSHLGLIAANMQGMYFGNLTEKDVHLLGLPMFHVAGLGLALMAMQSGGANVIMSRFDVEEALRNIEKYKISWMLEFPPMLSSILDKNEEIKCDISSLRVVGGLDDLETAKRCQDLTGGTFWTGFGQTETSGSITYGPYFEKLGSAGRPGHMAEVNLVNNAGIQIVHSFLDYTLEEFDQVIKTNLYGVFLVTRSVLPGMIEGKKGKIVNIASTAGKWGSRNQSAYNASKHAVVGLTRCLGLEVAPFNITVNAICPGAVEGTDMMEPFLEQNSKYYGIPKENLLGVLLTQSPMRRLIRPAEVADLAVYLASDESAGMTCQSIALCTGYTMV